MNQIAQALEDAGIKTTNFPVICNPIDALISLDAMDIANRAYLGRTLVSTINAMLIGQLASVVRLYSIEESSGIDGANSEPLRLLIQQQLEDEQQDAKGFESNDPAENARNLKKVANEICVCLSLSDAIAEAINTPASTLNFMRERDPNTVDKAMVAKLAKALEIGIEDATKAIVANNAKRQDQFRRDAPLIAERLLTLTMGKGFEDLPRRLQLRIAAKFETHLGAKLSNEIQRVISGQAENEANIPMLRGSIASIKAWIKSHDTHDELTKLLSA